MALNLAYGVMPPRLEGGACSRDLQIALRGGTRGLEAQARSGGPSEAWRPRLQGGLSTLDETRAQIILVENDFGNRVRRTHEQALRFGVRASEAMRPGLNVEHGCNFGGVNPDRHDDATADVSAAKPPVAAPKIEANLELGMSHQGHSAPNRR